MHTYVCMYYANAVANITWFYYSIVCIVDLRCIVHSTSSMHVCISLHLPQFNENFEDVQHSIRIQSVDTLGCIGIRIYSHAALFKPPMPLENAYAYIIN